MGGGTSRDKDKDGLQISLKEICFISSPLQVAYSNMLCRINSTI